MNVPAIPLKKSMRSAATEGNQMLSVRMLTKKVNSTQGEILDRATLGTVAEIMGYEMEEIQPGSLDDLREYVAGSLSERRPLLTCFAVDRATGVPTVTYADNEHACIITGFDRHTDTVEIAHWGKSYPGIPLGDLFGSMQALPATRAQEHYLPKSGATPAQFRPPTADAQIPAGLLASTVPPPDSGFANRLFLFEPDLTNPRWGQPQE